MSGIDKLENISNNQIIFWQELGAVVEMVVKVNMGDSDIKASEEQLKGEINKNIIIIIIIIIKIIFKKLLKPYF